MDFGHRISLTESILDFNTGNERHRHVDAISGIETLIFCVRTVVESEIHRVIVKNGAKTGEKGDPPWIRDAARCRGFQYISMTISENQC